SATMTETGQTESVVMSVNFDNLVFKRWLHCVGPVRRCELLKKLKTHLQNLGLSRRQVRRGLIQLATKPRVVLTRQPAVRRYGPRKLFLDENEEKSGEVATSVRTDIAFLQHKSQPKLKHIEKSDKTEIDTEKEYKRNEKVEDIKACRVELMDNPQETFVLNRNCKIGTKRSSHQANTTFISQDSTNNKKSPSDRKFECNKDESGIAHIENDLNRLSQKSSDLVSDKKSKSLNIVSVADNKKRMKVDSSMCYNQKDTESVKLSTKIFETAEKSTNIKGESRLSRTKYSMPEHCKGNITSEHFLEKNSVRCSDIKIGNIEENQHKRRLHNTLTADFVEKRRKIRAIFDEPEEIDRGKRKKLKKFRKYFGDCISVSEDEQEQDILQKKLKRRKKKDSVDSCDSGVCINEESVAANCEERLKDIRTAAHDSTIQEEFNEDTSNKIYTESDIINKLENGENWSKSVNQVMNVTSNETKSKVNSISYNISQMSNTDCNAQKAATTNVSKSQDNNLNNHDFNELLQMNFNDTCQITSSGNVLSIQEDIMKDENQNTVKENVTLSTNENLDLKTSVEKEPNSNPNKKHPEPVLNEIEENDDTLLSNAVVLSDAREDVNAVSINNNFCDILETVIKRTLLKPKLKDSMEQKNTQSNQVCQARLRVLSSAELGSRWCPTPINSVASNNCPSFSNTYTTITLDKSVKPVSSVPVSSSTSETVATTCTSRIISATSIPSSVSASTEAMPPLINSTKSTLDPKILDYVNVSLLKICNIIRSKRVPTQISRSDHDKLLYREFEQLRRTLNFEDFVTFIHRVINIFNKEVFVSTPLSLQELFYYTPSLHTLYLRNSCNQVGNHNEHQSYVNGCYPNAIPTVTSNIPIHQNMRRHPTSIQTGSQDSVPMNAMQQYPLNLNQTQQQCFSNLNQTSINTKSKQFQQNRQKKVVIPPEINVHQSKVSANPTFNSPLSTRHTRYRKRKQKPVAQQKTALTYITVQGPVTNINTSQGVLKPQIPNSSIGISQPGKYMYAPTKSTYTNQQYVAPNVDIPEGNPFYMVNASIPHNPVQQNINLVHTIQQQNVNMAYSMQQQNINLAHTNPLQNIKSGSQQFQKTVHRQPPPPYDVAQGTFQTQTVSQSFQNMQQNVPVTNYMPQPVQNAFVSSTHQSAPRNMQQKDQIYQRAPPQMQMKVSPNFSSDQKATPLSYLQKMTNTNFMENSKFPTKKTDSKAQMSLESTAKHFNVLKYLSDIQKMMLLKHINFYFGCTIWLEQEFSQEKWQKIQSERTVLLNFHTLLKNIVDKIVTDLLQNKDQANACEKNLLTNIKIDAPKEVQIIVQGDGLHCQVDVSNTDQVQSKVTNSESHQENLNLLIVQKQSEKQQKGCNTSEKTQVSNQSQDLKILTTKEAENNQEDKQEDIQQNAFPMLATMLEPDIPIQTEKSKSEVEQDSEDSTKEQILDKSEKAAENIASTDKEDASAAPDLEESNKDRLQQLPSHLITVEISPDSDYVTVVDIIGAHDIEDTTSATKVEMAREGKQSQDEELHPPPVIDNTHETLSECVSRSSNFSTECSNDTVPNDSTMEEDNLTQIADVRSISLEAFEKLGIGSNTAATVVEGNIEEEEIKSYIGKNITKPVNL
ncbi:hypothetical protein WN55_00413, partial [Dufourea novaeangliae]